jgi:hypothetical protein
MIQAPLLQLLALRTIIRQGCKWLAVTNALAYHITGIITSVKSVVIDTSIFNVIKLFFELRSSRTNELKCVTRKETANKPPRNLRLGCKCLPVKTTLA